MAEESGAADANVGVKFDMPNHESKMTAKDVKNLVRKYNVPLDLHPCAPTEGHHDYDVYDAFPDDDFSLQDVRSLLERIIDLRPVPAGLLFACGLATTWDFLGFFSNFKDTEGNGNVLRSFFM
ncbi:hypothetical protein Tco_0934733 [Tanacetum coccineum]